MLFNNQFIHVHLQSLHDFVPVAIENAVNHNSTGKQLYICITPIQLYLPIACHAYFASIVLATVFCMAWCRNHNSK